MRRLVLLAAALLLVGACTPRGAAPKQEIVFWSSEPDAAIAPVLRAFEAANPGLSVTLVTLPEAAAADSVAAAIARGTPPDLASLESSTLGPFMVRGQLSDWSAGVADLRPALLGWDLCLLGDAIFGMPWRLRPTALVYDRAVLARAGLDSTRGPADWDDLPRAAARLAARAPGVHLLGLPRGGSPALFAAFAALAFGAGAEFMTSTHDTLIVTSAPQERALGYLASLRRSAWLASEDSLAQALASGRLALAVADPALVARLAAEPGARRLGVAPFPAPAGPEGRRVAFLRGDVLVSFTGSRRKEDALRLARFLVQPEAAAQLAAASTGRLPANVGADSTAAFTARPLAQALLRQIEFARTAPLHERWPALETQLTLQIARAFAGELPALDALELADRLATQPEPATAPRNP